METKISDQILSAESAQPKAASETDGPAAATAAADKSVREKEASAKGKKSFSPMQYALLSAFVYPGAGQLARKQKLKGGLIIAVFSVFLIWWLIWLAMGIGILYYESVSGGVQYQEAMAEGLSYLKLSFIPGSAAAVIFIYSIYDAYKG